MSFESIAAPRASFASRGIPRPPPSRGAARVAFLALLVGAAASCGGTPAPSAGQARGFVPSLIGRKVIVFPVQRDLGVGGNATAEMVFALQGSGAGPEWLLPDELRSTMARSGSLDAPLENLPVDVFLQAQVDRIGDPIYGILRRIGAVTSADLALIPIAVRPGPAALDSTGAVIDGPVAAEYVATLLDVRTGRVIWFGAEGGSRGPVGDPNRLASAAEALARRLVPRRTNRDPILEQNR